MLISAVEEGIESLLRSTLPLSSEQGDVSFEAPSSTWAAGVNRLTVNVFLYGVTRSSQPPRVQAPQRNDGQVVRRFALPMVQLSYLVSAWAGSPRDEHELLGDVLIRFLSHPLLPAEHLGAALESSVQLAVENDDHNRPREIWGAVGGHVKASFSLQATVAADAYPWETAPPLVDRVNTTVHALPDRRQ
ncbi:DUF4255 domain-containing protein [Pseudactinotalea sp.]|uniref:DUF4255 domain-containing protein n=1 Tax=Pseudactinotalea sp. TaxID=1926260 RepID=UPI003B3ABB63